MEHSSGDGHDREAKLLKIFPHISPLEGIFLVLLSMMGLLALPVKGEAPGILQLHCGFTSPGGSSSRLVDAERLKAHDRIRRQRILSDAIGFPLGGSSDPFLAGLYFTEINLGSPSKKYYVQVDTGSDVSWVNCKPCHSCPTMSGFRIPLIAYDPQSSSTSLPISCASPACHVAVTIAEAGCNSDKNCGYFFQYGDGSSTHGYLVTDSFSYNPVGYGSTVSKKETKLIFGCGYNQSGNLVTSDRALDGILGLGQSDLSIVSQLASQGRAPKAFGHCLRGIGNGGGALILGHVKEPGLVYTPIVRSRLHYNVEMRNILVNNVALNVNASSFEAGNSQETIFDSGTTLTYVSEPLYKAFMQAILAHLPPQAEIIQVQDNTCFYYSGSVENHFPNVTIRFKGADMHLKANNYLIEEPSQNPPIWCVGWQVSASYNGITLVIFGDLVLKDKLVTYDLEKRQIGWANYDYDPQALQASRSHRRGRITM